MWSMGVYGGKSAGIKAVVARGTDGVDILKFGRREEYQRWYEGFNKNSTCIKLLVRAFVSSSHEFNKAG